VKRSLNPIGELTTAYEFSFDPTKHDFQGYLDRVQKQAGKHFVVRELKESQEGRPTDTGNVSDRGIHFADGVPFFPNTKKAEEKTELHLCELMEHTYVTLNFYREPNPIDDIRFNGYAM
jgi:hypothetical protein